jgi:hypothetical protein
VSGIARSNWEKFVADEFEEPMQGHLLSYPIDVSQDGTVSFLEALLFIIAVTCWKTGLGCYYTLLTHYQLYWLGAFHYEFTV